MAATTGLSADGTTAVPVIAGHPYLTSGGGEDTRAWIQAFSYAGLHGKAFDIYRCQQPTADFAALVHPHLTDQPGSTVNLFVLNGDEVEQAFAHLAGRIPESAYDIVYPT